MGVRNIQTRDEIIKAAKMLFYQHGYQQTSFDDVADETGISQVCLNYYFKTKNDILSAVLEHRANEYIALFSSWEKKCPDAKQCLRRFIKFVALNKDDLVRYGCPIGSLNTVLGMENGGSPNAVRYLADIFIQWLTFQFQKILPADQVKQHSIHLLCRTSGLSVVAHAFGDPAIIDAEIKLLEKWLDEL